MPYTGVFAHADNGARALHNAGAKARSGVTQDRSKPVGEKQDDHDYQEQADQTVAAVPEAVTWAAEAATETTEQKDDKEDDEDCSKRHDCTYWGSPRAYPRECQCAQLAY